MARFFPSYVFTGNGLHNIIWWSSQQLCDDGELVDMVLSREQGLSIQHFSKDATGAPYVHFNIIFLPCKHDLGRSVVSGRDIAGHLRILESCKTEVADFQITILVDKNVTGLEVTVNNAGRMDVFQPTLNSDVSTSLSKGWIQALPESGTGSIV